MKLYDKFRAHIWLVNLISSSRHGMTLSEINERWLDEEISGGEEMSRSTFLRHKEAIEQMFGLYIECDAHNGYRYYIGNEHVLHENSLQNWLLSTLTVGGLISDSLSMQQRILLEEVAADSRTLELLIRAMRRNRYIDLDYRRYMAEAGKHYAGVAAYCLKLSRQRWYLLGRLANGEYRVFALDRICQVRLTKQSFTIDPYFDASDFFSECYGIVACDNTPPERIVVRAFGREQHAMAALPLHHTQHRIAATDTYTDFELTLRPTADFKAHLLSRGRWLRVVHPTRLADEIRQMHLDAAAEPHTGTPHTGSDPV